MVARPALDSLPLPARLNFVLHDLDFENVYIILWLVQLNVCFQLQGSFRVFLKLKVWKSYGIKGLKVWKSYGI